jgi:hypothetical protein
MKIEIDIAKDKEVEYPSLRISNCGDLIVLFEEEGSGTVVKDERKSEYKHSVGFSSNHWAMRTFKDFDGKITLSND